MAVVKTLSELAVLTGSRVVGSGGEVIRDVAGIEDAGPGDITFLANPRYAPLLASTGASAVILDEAAAAGVDNRNLLVAKDPMLAFIEVLKVLRPQPRPGPGIDPRAVVHPDAVLAEGVSVQAGAFIDSGARIGAGSSVYPGVYIGRSVEVGEQTLLYSNVSIREGSKIGSRVIVHCSAVIGSDGFGFARDGSRHMKIPQTGIVVIGDDVEIGACVTIDRATVGETVVARGTKIDNLVHLAHNVKVGEDSLIVAQVGVSGSTKIGSRVTLAGQVGVAGHVVVADDSIIGAKSGVTKDVTQGGVFTGYPVLPHRVWLKAQALFAKIPEMKRRIDELEKKLSEFEEKAGGRHDRQR